MNFDEEDLKRARIYCLDEWNGVNDPPCHPGDSDWKGCPLCLTPDRGPWTAGRDNAAEKFVCRTFVESDDFHHDVRLYINGDFSDDEQRFAYAQWLADRLNKT